MPPTSTDLEIPPPAEPSIRDLDRERRLVRQDMAAPTLERWRRRHRYYYGKIAQLFGRHVPADGRVLHIGCGIGDLLASVGGTGSLGIDLSPSVIDIARRRHRGLAVRAEDPQDFCVDEQYDYVIIDTALADASDIQACLECA